MLSGLHFYLNEILMIHYIFNWNSLWSTGNQNFCEQFLHHISYFENICHLYSKRGIVVLRLIFHITIILPNFSSSYNSYLLIFFTFCNSLMRILNAKKHTSIVQIQTLLNSKFTYDVRYCESYLVGSLSWVQGFIIELQNEMIWSN